MRAQTLAIGLLQVVLLMACDRVERNARVEGNAEERGNPSNALSSKASAPGSAAAARDRAVSPEETSAGAPPGDNWFSAAAFDPATRLIVRTGQASIEVDSLGPSMTDLRRIVQR